jgi:glycosyltransferase involved in cell wall biosynthesis
MVFTAKNNHKLRVVLLVTGFPDRERPNSGIFNLRAAKALNSRTQVTVIHLRTWLPGRKILTHSEYSGIPVLTLAGPRLPVFDQLSLALYRETGWRLLRNVLKDSDLIHSVGVDFAAVLGACWAKRSGICHVAQAVGSDLNSDRSLALRGVADHVHAVACNSQALVEEFRQRYPAIPNVRRVLRGIDLQAFRPDGCSAGPQAGRRPVRFLYLGGFPSSRKLTFGSNTKGGLTLLAAWRGAEEELAAAGASVLIANIPRSGQPVISWRSSLKYPEQVDVAGTIDPTEVPAYLRASDVVLIPSLQEGLPNVATEASACARAVFASDVGGLPEVVVHGETGLVLPAGNAEAWQAALVQYASELPKLRAMGEAGHLRMETVFDARNYPEQMCKLYEIALGQPR